MKREEGQAYMAAMLRLQQFRRDEELVWWFSLENVRTGERHNFTSLESLSSFLEGLVVGLSNCPQQTETGDMRKLS